MQEDPAYFEDIEGSLRERGMKKYRVHREQRTLFGLLPQAVHDGYQTLSEIGVSLREGWRVSVNEDGLSEEELEYFSALGEEGRLTIF